ncbi:signal peptidase I [Paenibacillus silviterrae]|uniref:signal peptidase I n=1 Tax=Paenibacillus silviterrae TaxID=3242194 RepID=UPI002543D33E|nr:signal peptidase I [Paenibacillus chinjuensis]
MKLFYALLLAVSIYTQDLKPFVVEGPSMEPSLFAQDRIIIDTSYYESHNFERGDLIVFHATPSRDYVKRIIALPGERIKVDGDQVYVNGELLEEPYLQEAIASAKQKGRPFNTRNYRESTVPNGTVFVLGDNRSNSSDSRDIGFVKLSSINGKIININGWPVK